MGETIDIDHMRKLEETNKKFTRQIISSTEKKIMSDANTYAEMMKIGESLDNNILEYTTR